MIKKILIGLLILLLISMVSAQRHNCIEIDMNCADITTTSVDGFNIEAFRFNIDTRTHANQRLSVGTLVGSAVNLSVLGNSYVLPATNVNGALTVGSLNVYNNLIISGTLRASKFVGKLQVGGGCFTGGLTGVRLQLGGATC
ncbi:MAG: hypothetical protein KJ847_04245 [Firmicutes bacterium]|nr:hypothetical protein [Bacillota bacterium]